MARTLGCLLIIAGLIPVACAFVEFARAGGTPVPVAPTRHLVVTGFNRYVRSPMYIGLLVIIVGQSLLLGQLSLLLYAAGVWAVTASFVRWYEEPALARQFGGEYETYRHAVPGWLPRRRPWRPSTPGPSPCAETGSSRTRDTSQPAGLPRREPGPSHRDLHPGPRLGRRLARFTRLVLNRLTLRVAGRLPGMGIIIHTGRRSGRTCRTPVLVFASGDGFVVALTYGRQSQWVQNVLAAGGCQLLARRQRYRLADPEVFHDEHRSLVPLLPRLVLTIVRASDFPCLHDAAISRRPDVPATETKEVS